MCSASIDGIRVTKNLFSYPVAEQKKIHPKKQALSSIHSSKIINMIDRLLILEEKKIPTESQVKELCAQIDDPSTTLHQAVRLAAPYCPNAALLSSIFFRTYQEKKVWEFKKLLYKKLPPSLQIPQIMTYMMAEAGLQGHKKMFHQIFSKAINEKKADEATYNWYIKINGQNKDFAKAQKVFYEACKKGIASIKTYNIYIHAAGINQRWKEAKRTFAAIKPDANDSTYNSYLTVLKLQGRYGAAKHLLATALAAEKISPITFRIQIEFAMDQKDLNEVRRLYALAKQHQCVNEDSHMVYLHALVALGQEDEAKAFFDILQIPLCTKFQDGLLMLDLHDFSYGAGYLALCAFIEHPQCPDCFGLIHGKGNIQDGNYLVFQSYLLNKIHTSIQGWMCKPDAFNKGRLILEKEKVEDIDWMKAIADPQFLQDVELGAQLWKEAKKDHSIV